MRQAVLRLLGRLKSDELSKESREKLIPVVARCFREDPDSGVHAMADWLLRRWPRGDLVERMEAQLMRDSRSPEKRWYITPAGYTMAVVKGPITFTMGTPDGEFPARAIEEKRHHVRIDRSFAIATKEVTVRQFLRFHERHEYLKEFSPDDGCPVNSVTWYDAARYCRWLSEQEGIPEAQMCFPKIEEIAPPFEMYPDYLSRTGYRLPTEAEWEAACRAGTTTSRFYGNDPSLLGEFGWYTINSARTSHPVGSLLPNPLGCFDMLGNVHEHCIDVVANYPVLDGQIRCDVENLFRVTDGDRDNYHVARGGSLFDPASYLRCGSRNGAETSADKNYSVGFRIVRTQQGP